MRRAKAAGKAGLLIRPYCSRRFHSRPEDRQRQATKQDFGSGIASCQKPDWLVQFGNRSRNCFRPDMASLWHCWQNAKIRRSFGPLVRTGQHQRFLCRQDIAGDPSVHKSRHGLRQCCLRATPAAAQKHLAQGVRCFLRHGDAGELKRDGGNAEKMTARFRGSLRTASQAASFVNPGSRSCALNPPRIPRVSSSAP